MKRAIVKISGDILTQILSGLKYGFNGRFKVTKNGLPEDVKFIDAYVEEGRNLVMKLESESFEDIKTAGLHEPPVLTPPVMQAIQEKDPIFWLCGQFRKETAFGNVWDFQGLFHLRDDAIKACKKENYFVVPVNMDAELPEDMKNWDVVEYPLRDESNDTP